MWKKQALALCEEATIMTTKGTVRFTPTGRTVSGENRSRGSVVILKLRMTAIEREEVQYALENYLPPSGMQFLVNGQPIAYRSPKHTIEAKLPTVIESNGALRTSIRKTTLHLLQKRETAYLYEMGIPICEIDCDFDVDVQQKVPLSPDREAVTPQYLAQVYAAVFSAISPQATTEQAAQTWARTAVEHPHVTAAAAKDWVSAVYGEKVVVANPRDPNSIDEAISRGYKVVYGAELPKGIWANIKKAEEELHTTVMPSSTELFGAQKLVTAKPVVPDEAMRAVADLATRIARRCMRVDITVSFIESTATIAADYGDRVLRFNVKRLGRTWFTDRVSATIIDLLIHELAHEEGGHTEHSYHEAATKLAGELVLIALTEPRFFETPLKEHAP